jgi:hypothetical protein
MRGVISLSKDWLDITFVKRLAALADALWRHCRAGLHGPVTRRTQQTSLAYGNGKHNTELLQNYRNHFLFM